MRIVSVLENQKIEKRIAITPDIAKKYIALGFEVVISEKYGEHLGFKDNDYKELGVEILKKENEVLSNADVIIQLGLLSDDNLSLLKKDQTLIGVFNPYFNKENVVLQKDLHSLQGKKRTWFCGSYFGYGFHEDGLKSSIELIKNFKI